VAVAVAISAAAPRRPLGIGAEALFWALAIAAKLTTWPLAIALPFFWRWQRASRWRVAAVIAACAISATLTCITLAARTQNPLGHIAFDQPGGAPVATPIHVVSPLKFFVNTLAWTSGEHLDMLQPLGVALYALPVLAAVLVAARRRDLFLLAAAVLAAFAVAQAFNVVACIVARRAGNPMPPAGKEGWYWFVLLPILVPALLAPAVKRFPLVAWWIVAWDVVITDAQLFHTWAGELSPARPSFLFRWGPLRAPLTTAWAAALRAANLALFAVLQRKAK